MPSKPNYNHQRAERDRAKKAKKEAKLEEKRQASSQRDAPPEPGAADEPAKAE